MALDFYGTARLCRKGTLGKFVNQVPYPGTREIAKLISYLHVFSMRVTFRRFLKKLFELEQQRAFKL
jgi:hypothetical protein